MAILFDHNYLKMYSDKHEELVIKLPKTFAD